MLIIDHQARAACANCARSACLISTACDLQFSEVRFNLAASRLQLEPSFFWKVNLDIAVVIVHLHVAQLAHANFNRAIAILQAHVAAHARQADIFRASQHAKWSNNINRSHII